MYPSTNALKPISALYCWTLILLYISRIDFFIRCLFCKGLNDYITLSSMYGIVSFPCISSLIAYYETLRFAMVFPSLPSILPQIWLLAFTNVTINEENQNMKYVFPSCTQRLFTCALSLFGHTLDMTLFPNLSCRTIPWHIPLSFSPGHRSVSCIK